MMPLWLIVDNYGPNFTFLFYRVYIVYRYTSGLCPLLWCLKNRLYAKTDPGFIISDYRWGVNCRFVFSPSASLPRPLLLITLPSLPVSLLPFPPLTSFFLCRLFSPSHHLSSTILRGVPDPARKSGRALAGALWVENHAPVIALFRRLSDN